MILIEQSIGIVLLLQGSEPRQLIFPVHGLDRLVPVGKANVDFQCVRARVVGNGGADLLREVLDRGVGRVVAGEFISPCSGSSYRGQ